MTLARIPLSGLEVLGRSAILKARRRRELRDQVDQWVDERTSLASYIPAVHRTDVGLPAYPPEHLQQVIRAIEDDSLGHTVIVAPVGSAKTATAMASLAWQIGREPNRHFGYLSSTADQAHRRSVAIRDTIAFNTSYRAIFPEAAPDYHKGWAEGEWYLQRPDTGDKDPTLLAVGVGGAIQGARLDRAVLDDIADKKNMATPYLRQKVTDWLDEVFMGRLTPWARCIMIANRWASDDPVAWAIRHGWFLVHIKAVDEAGQSYWPQRWPVNKLACLNDQHGQGDPDWQPSEQQAEPPCWVERDAEGRITHQGRCARAGMTGRAFNLVYQGETTDDASAIWKRSYWQRYKLEYRPNGAPLLPTPASTAGVFLDLAHEEKTSADFTVTGRVYYAPPRFYLTDVIRRRLEFPEVVELLRALLKPNLPAHELPRTAGVLEVLRGIHGGMRETGREPPAWEGLPLYIEDTPGSKPLIQTLRREVPGVLPWAIEGRSKMARSSATSAFAEAGNVFIPEDAPWAGDFIEELAAFPTGEHDDQADFLTMALLRFTGGGALVTY